MKFVFLFSALFLCCFSAEFGNDYVRKDGFLHQYFHKGSDIVVVPYDDPAFVNVDYLQQQAKMAVGTLSYWDFIPGQIPVVIYPDTPVQWEGPCFKTITATLEANSTTGNLTITAKDKKSPVCGEFYGFGDRESFYLLEMEIGGTHHMTITWSEYEYDDIQSNGLKVFLFPANEVEVAASVLMTISLFQDSPKMFEENVQFINEKMQWAMQKRSVDYVPMVDSDIKSGDYLAILRLDGLDPLIMWGTGGHTGHTAVALWFGDELYICESTDTSSKNGSHAYWPPPYGIIKTPYDQWVTQAEAAGYIVAVLRLDPTYGAQFDETKATDWFKTVEGMPYGWHNFIYTFIDTMYNNLPRPTTPDLMESVLGVYEPMQPIESKASVNSMVIQGLNHRLNANCDTLHCIYGVLDAQGLPLFQAATLPENDTWTYPGNGCPYSECYSMVCDVFVMEMYRNAGLQLPSFQSTEQAPKDTYQLAIYDTNWVRPEKCVQADPDLPYCQILGDYKLTLNGFNSIEPYNEMNHYCPAYAPVYMRSPSNC